MHITSAIIMIDITERGLPCVTIPRQPTGSGKKTISLRMAGVKRKFDLDDPKLPNWIEDNALSSGGYPYAERIKSSEYEETLTRLQIELVKLPDWLQATDERIICLFEGRDAAGKGAPFLPSTNI